MGLPVLLLPGAVLPAELAYAGLLDALEPGVDAVAKDLELYAGDDVPAGYTLDVEVDGVLRLADSRGWERFHLVGYSGGGASALAFAARQPDRLSSLAVLEPAWAGGWDQSPAEQAFWRRHAEIEALPAEEFMAAFMRLAVGPGVSLPPPSGEPPPWMASRPAGIAAFTRTFRSYELDRNALEGFPHPVYVALGGRSNPDQYAEIARRLARVFRDCELEVFEERHHFDPPHRAEPDRLARSLQRLWERAES